MAVDVFSLAFDALSCLVELVGKIIASNSMGSENLKENPPLVSTFEISSFGCGGGA
jgi:hypothetical protein